MHIAIDDTYGQAGDGTSEYVTNKRRTHVAVVFQDQDVQQVREQLKNYLSEVQSQTGINASEFHFVEIYNRTGTWASLKNNNSGINLDIIERFAEIYSENMWPVHIQTVDDLTLTDHGVTGFDNIIDGLDLKKREDQSLLFLLIKLKQRYKSMNEPITLVVDEGRRKPGTEFGKMTFHDWPKTYIGMYQSSKSEPLLQIADFLAFSINRLTHITLKSRRTEIDNWFIALCSFMRINSPDLAWSPIPKNFSPRDVDNVHKNDRRKKGLGDEK